MARWKLVGPHYLMTTDNKWEYQEVDRNTGRQIRKQFEVPRHLDPRDPSDWTESWGNKDNQDGIIVVKQGVGESRDITFVGDPTPDMIPIDDEAKAISAGFEHQWKYKVDIDQPTGFSQSLVDKFQSDMAEKQAKPASVEGMAELVAAMTAMTHAMAANQRRV